MQESGQVLASLLSLRTYVPMCLCAGAVPKELLSASRLVAAAGAVVDAADAQTGSSGNGKAPATSGQAGAAAAVAAQKRRAQAVLRSLQPYTSTSPGQKAALDEQLLLVSSLNQQITAQLSRWAAHVISYHM